MDGKILARLGAIIFVALAITATVIDMTRKEPAPIDMSVPPAVAPAADPLRTGVVTRSASTIVTRPAPAAGMSAPPQRLAPLHRYTSGTLPALAAEGYDAASGVNGVNGVGGAGDAAHLRSTTHAG